MTGRRSRLVDLLGLLAGVALGVVVAVAAVLAHRTAGEVAGVEVPWGVVLAVLGSVAVSLGVGAVTQAAWPVAGYGIGWCAIVLLLLAGRPEGDYLVAGDGRGWGFLVGGSLSVVVVTLRGVLLAPTRVSPGADPQDGLLPKI